MTCLNYTHNVRTFKRFNVTTFEGSTPHQHVGSTPETSNHARETTDRLARSG